MPSSGNPSTRVYRRRSPSQDVRTSPPESRPVAVLSCCTTRCLLPHELSARTPTTRAAYRSVEPCLGQHPEIPLLSCSDLTHLPNRGRCVPACLCTGPHEFIVLEDWLQLRTGFRPDIVMNRGWACRLGATDSYANIARSGTQIGHSARWFRPSSSSDLAGAVIRRHWVETFKFAATWLQRSSAERRGPLVHVLLCARRPRCGPV
jgi:hypothetical protein